MEFESVVMWFAVATGIAALAFSYVEFLLFRPDARHRGGRGERLWAALPPLLVAGVFLITFAGITR